jgi:putative endonuclease
VSEKPWYVYVVECSDQTLYTGVTTHVERRIKQHNTGKGAAYTSIRRPVRLVAAWCFPDHSAALKAEIRFKRQTRQAKLRAIDTRAHFLDAEFCDFKQS